MKAKHRESHILSITVLIIIFAFVLGVLVYVGGALLQLVNFTHISEPGTAIESAILGAILGTILVLMRRNKSKREL